MPPLTWNSSLGSVLNHELRSSTSFINNFTKVFYNTDTLVGYIYNMDHTVELFSEGTYIMSVKVRR